MTENKKPIENPKNKVPVKRNLLIPKWDDVKNVKRNWKIVSNSPYASLKFSLLVRKLFIGLIIFMIAITTIQTVISPTVGWMAWISKIFMVGLMTYVCWKIYGTLKVAKLQLEYYERNPEFKSERNEADVRKTVDDILDMFDKKTNQRKQTEKEVQK